MTQYQLKSIVGVFICFALFFSGCSNKEQVWIYTSLYKETISEIKKDLQKDFPDVEIKFYQGGSEIVASKVNAELAAGGTKADLLITSDPFWYLELKNKQLLLPYNSPKAKAVPSHLKDPDHAFACSRIPVMVMAYNSEVLEQKNTPKTWKELLQTQWKDKVSMGSPLESGTNFTTVSFLSETYGWNFFKGLRKLNIISAGGNSSVMTRMETKERPVGIVLLENILKSQQKGSPVKPIYPQDGVIAIPSPIAITKDTKNPELTKKVYDWFFSDKAQNAIVKSGMYSPLPHINPPKNARPWKELSANAMKWSPEVLKTILNKRSLIKKNFSEIVLH